MGMRDRFQRRLDRVIELSIRNKARVQGYYCLGNSEYDNAKILGNAKEAVVETFKQYAKQLSKYYTPEQIAAKYFDKLEKEIKMDQIRKGELALGDIEDLRKEDLTFGAEYSNVQFFDEAIKMKMAEHGLNIENKVRANELFIDVKDDVVTHGRQLQIIPKERIYPENIKADIVMEGRQLKVIHKKEIKAEDIKDDVVSEPKRKVLPEDIKGDVVMEGRQVGRTTVKRQVNDIKGMDNSQINVGKEYFPKDNVGLQAYLNKIELEKHSRKNLNQNSGRQGRTSSRRSKKRESGILRKIIGKAFAR